MVVLLGGTGGSVVDPSGSQFTMIVYLVALTQRQLHTFLIVGVQLLVCSTIVHAQISSRYVCETRSTPFVEISDHTSVIEPNELVNAAGEIDFDDGIQRDIPVGFKFEYNGNSYTSVNVCPNGWVSLGSGMPIPTTTSDCANLFLSNEPNNVLAPYWGDHIVRTLADVPSGYSVSAIQYQTDASADPNGNGEPGQFLHVFTVEWNTLNVNDKTDPQSTATFQVKIIQNPLAHDLTSPDNRATIEFHYGPIGPSVRPAGCTVGIEDSVGLSFMNGLFPSIVANGDSTRLSHSRTADCWPPPSCITGTVIVFRPRPSDASVANDVGVDLAHKAIVFPNPCCSQAHIRAVLSSTGQSTLTVYDALGRPVASQVCDRSEPGYQNFAIDVSSLSNGVYQYRIEGSSPALLGSFAVKK